jgi:hypothetical protein
VTWRFCGARWIAARRGAPSPASAPSSGEHADGAIVLLAPRTEYIVVRLWTHSPMQVGLHLSKEVPLMVEYKVESIGYIRFYLAPKIDEE